VIRPSHALAVLALAVAPTVTAATLAAADDWARDYPAAPELAVTTGDFPVAITSWDEPRIHIEVHTEHWAIGHGGLRIVDGQDRYRVAFTLHEPPFELHFGLERRRARVDVRVPRGTRLDVRVSDATVTVDGVRGDAAIHASDGPIDVAGFDGTLHVSASDGPVRLAGRFDGLDVKASDGPVTIDVAPGSHTGGGWTVRTGDGPLRLLLPDDLRATLDVTTSDGRIDADLPVTLSGRIHDDALRADLNGGGGELRVHTSDGPVQLGRHDDRAPAPMPEPHHGVIRHVHHAGH